MLVFPHCSNVIGHINPVKEISQRAHKHGALSVVDGVAYAPHAFPDALMSKFIPYKVMQ